MTPKKTFLDRLRESSKGTSLLRVQFRAALPDVETALNAGYNPSEIFRQLQTDKRFNGSRSSFGRLLRQHLGKEARKPATKRTTAGEPSKRPRPGEPYPNQ